MTVSLRADDTIAAVATPAGRGAIGVVRLSGPEALTIAARLFRGRDPRDMPGFTAAYGFVEEGGERLDEALCLVMRGPRSYTRQDVVEFQCHGGPVLLRRVLAAMIREGARPAQPGEFTRRAFLAGRIDLAQAEAVADLIAGETAAAARAALDQLSGVLSRDLSALQRRLAEMLARLEAGIDFSDEEDVVAVEPGELSACLAETGAEMSRLIHSAGRGRLLREGARVVIAGLPNVGKSTLMNALIGQERVIVTPLPGTTRDVVEDLIEISGVPVRLFDTAGLREGGDNVEAIGVSRARAALAGADLVLLVLDGAAPISEEDRAIARELERRALIVVNKSDLPPAVEREAIQALAAGGKALRISALTGQGIPELLKEIGQALLGDAGAAIPAMTNLRHLQALARALSALRGAQNALTKNLSAEFMASDLRLSLTALGEITGATADEDLLDLIFSRFCIGK